MMVRNFGKYTTSARFLRAKWQTSSRCINGQCVEIARAKNHLIGIRDSKQSRLGIFQPILTVSPAGYRALLDELLSPSSQKTTGEVTVTQLNDGCVVLSSPSTGVELRFDQDEIEAFTKGVEVGELLPDLQLVR